MAQIKTYARLKPTKKIFSGYEINQNILTVHIPDSKDYLTIGSHQPLRSNLSYDIMFTDIYQPHATQQDVFDGVAKDIIQSFINGYNGTIFAYGQTGTGKTYTVEGNPQRYGTRGLSTRALSMIYQQLEDRPDDHVTVCLSYLEIYQEVAYDLLSPISKATYPMTPFTRVTVVEGPQGSCILRGLSLHMAENEEIAQMLLLQGQINRRVAETPVNQRSSRSHAVFTVYLQIRRHDSDILLNSKLHLVDLAGSERVSKTGVDGQQLTEAKSINLSLHHLETVIVALQADRGSSGDKGSSGEKTRGDNGPTQTRSNTSFMSGPSSDSGSKPYKYVPYRNSLLTMVLKDSLGGNCLTAMIATISLEPQNLGESISTCRFAQRVARIANNARRNEAVDDKTQIKRLQHKVAHLETQVATLKSSIKRSSLITSEDILEALSDEDRTICAKIMDEFLEGKITDPIHAGIDDQRRFQVCLHLLKQQYLGTVLSNPQMTLHQHLRLPSKKSLAHLPFRPGDLLQPNNPHRDSGDHNMSDSMQISSTLSSSQQRPAVSCSSKPKVQAHGEFRLTAARDQGVSQANAVKGEKLRQTQLNSPRPKEMKKYREKRAEPTTGKDLSPNCPMNPDKLLEELLISERNLEVKLKMLEVSVTEQAQLVSHLRLISASPDQVEQAQAEHQQLLRRQVKTEAKLCQVIETRKRLQDKVLLNRRSQVSARSDSSLLNCGSTRASDNANAQQQHSWQRKGRTENHRVTPSTTDRCQAKVQHGQKELATSDEFSHSWRQNLQNPWNQVVREFGSFSRGKGLSPPNVSHEDSLSSGDTKRLLRTKDSQSSSLIDSLVINKAKADTTSNCLSRSNRSGSSRAHGKTSRKSHLTPASSHKQESELLDGDTLGGEVRRGGSGSVISSRAGEVKRFKDKPSYLSGIMSPNLMQAIKKLPIAAEDLWRTQQSPELEVSDSPTPSGEKPIEMPSFHDPHHSHKFSLDNGPTYCLYMNGINRRLEEPAEMCNSNNSCIYPADSNNIPVFTENTIAALSLESQREHSINSCYGKELLTLLNVIFQSRHLGMRNQSQNYKQLQPLLPPDFGVNKSSLKYLITFCSVVWRCLCLKETVDVLFLVDQSFFGIHVN